MTLHLTRSHHTGRVVGRVRQRGAECVYHSGFDYPKQEQRKYRHYERELDRGRACPRIAAEAANFLPQNPRKCFYPARHVIRGAFPIPGTPICHPMPSRKANAHLVLNPPLTAGEGLTGRKPHLQSVQANLFWNRQDARRIL
ncbi:MAG: hypothetical protein ACREHV_09345 [Rhizomicrobium sp.]